MRLNVRLRSGRPHDDRQTGEWIDEGGIMQNAPTWNLATWSLAALCASLWTGVACAQIAVSANDAHSVSANGVSTTPKDAPPDNLAVIDLSQSPPKIIAKVDAPT